jgi:hypothetical protein
VTIDGPPTAAKLGNIRGQARCAAMAIVQWIAELKFSLFDMGLAALSLL